MLKTKVKKKAISSAFEDAILVNNQTYTDYLERLKRIAVSMFVWDNLPDTMNSRYLELCLYYKGKAALLYDTDYGFINTQVADSGYINIYGLPTLINCYSYSFNTQRNLYVPDSDENSEKDKEAILVMNNYERIPTCSMIELFAARLCEAQRLIDTNVNSSKTPLLILCDKNQEFSLRNMYAQYDGNTPVIYGDRNQLNPDSITTLKTDAPFLVDKVIEYKRELWNEALTALGISNLSEKKERLIDSEANTNNELINLNLQSFLIPRQQACKEFNDKFGFTGTDKEISVKLRSDLFNIIKQAESITNEYTAGKDTE